MQSLKTLKKYCCKQRLKNKKISEGNSNNIKNIYLTVC